MEQGLDGLSQLLGSQQYLTGNQPTAADCHLFAFLDNLIFDGLPGIVTQTYRQLGLQHENLLAFTERLRRQLYPDAPQRAAALAEQ